MATFKVALLWALAATIGLAFFGLQCRSSNRLSVELVAKLAVADLRQQQLNEEGDKLRREIRVLRHDIDDYRDRLAAKSDSLGRCEKAEEECKASLAKLEQEQSRTDEAAQAREDELQEQQHALSQKLKQAESDINMRQADLLSLQGQMNETVLNLSKAEEKIRVLLNACQDTPTIAVYNATAVTLPSKGVYKVSATATAFVKNVTTVVTPAAATDVVITASAAVKDRTNTSVTLANSDSADGKSVNVTKALDTFMHVTSAKDALTDNVVNIHPDDADADGVDTDDAQLLPADQDEEQDGGDEGSEGQGR